GDRGGPATRSRSPDESRGPMTRADRAPLAAAIVGVLLLLVLDGWLPLRPAARAASAVPPELAQAISNAAQDLTARATALSSTPEVQRSLAGGGIAVNRLVLFSAGPRWRGNRRRAEKPFC